MLGEPGPQIHFLMLNSTAAICPGVEPSQSLGLFSFCCLAQLQCFYFIYLLLSLRKLFSKERLKKGGGERLWKGGQVGSNWEE